MFPDPPPPHLSPVLAALGAARFGTEPVEGPAAEYERTLTTVANAYVQPRVARYISNLEKELTDRGVTADLHILRSDGGLGLLGRADQDGAERVDLAGVFRQDQRGRVHLGHDRRSGDAVAGA